jgi:hypothetical protein
MVMNCIRTAKIAECLVCLSRLVAPCNLWSQLKFSILASLQRARERATLGKNKNKKTCEVEQSEADEEM